MKRETTYFASGAPDRRAFGVAALRLCLPWAGIMVLAGALFLTLRQLGLVLLIFIPLLWLYGRECMHRKAIQRQRHFVENRMASVLETLSEGVLILDGEGCLIAVNPAAEKLLGYGTDELIDQPLEMVMPDTGAHPMETPSGKMVQKCLASGIPVQVEELSLLTRNGRTIPVFFAMAPLVEDGTVTGLVVVFQGLSERKELQNKLKMVSTVDPVTGVKNRWETERHLSVEMERARRHQRPLSILMVDIDHYKRISDTYGPHNGDTVLRAACNAMTGMMRASDIVGTIRR